MSKILLQHFNVLFFWWNNLNTHERDGVCVCVCREREIICFYWERWKREKDIMCVSERERKREIVCVYLEIVCVCSVCVCLCVCVCLLRDSVCVVCVCVCVSIERCRREKDIMWERGKKRKKEKNIDRKQRERDWEILVMCC